MGTNKKLVQAAAVFAFCMALQTRVLADGVSPAARLSASLGGELGDGMSDAGGIGHGSMNSMVEPRIGRSAAYRKRVALDSHLAASGERLASVLEHRSR